jgi:hypothetical protein
MSQNHRPAAPAIDLTKKSSLFEVPYILLNRKLRKDVPADIQGLQRIEYLNENSLEPDSLIPQIVKYLVLEHTHPRNLFKKLSGNNRNKQLFFALEVLAHLRDNGRLPSASVRRLCPGSYLRGNDKDRVLSIMEDLGLIGSVNSKNGARLIKNLFSEPLR